MPGCLVGVFSPLIGGLAGGLYYILILNDQLTSEQRTQAITGCLVGSVVGPGIAFGVRILVIEGAAASW